MQSDTITIYHNPRCSKSRGALAIINEYCEKHPEFQIQEIRYLENPPNKETLQTLLKQLDVPIQDIIRSGEKLFKELGYSKADLKNFDELHWLEVLTKHSKLIERPIVEFRDKAVIGRPPEKVNDLLVD